MIQYVVLAVLIGSACSAPAAEPNPAPHHGTQAHEAPTHGAPAHGALAHGAPAHEPAHEPAAVEAEHELNDAPISSAHGEHPGHAGHAGHNEHGAVPSPVPAGKQLLIAEYPLLKTPASTAKLTPVATSFVAPIPPLTYAAAPAVLTSYPWSGLAALPASYSIEQHGYHITY